MVEVEGISSVAVKCVEIRKNTGGESALLGHSDTQRRKLGEQKGLDTPVVPAVNDGYLALGFCANRVFSPAT